MLQERTRNHKLRVVAYRRVSTDQEEQQKEGFTKESQECAGQILQQVCPFRKTGLRGVRFYVPQNYLG